MRQMDSGKCDEDIHKHGECVGVYVMPKEEAEQYCQRLTAESETHDYDWHYVGGRVVVKRLEKKGPEKVWDENRGDGQWA